MHSRPTHTAFRPTTLIACGVALLLAFASVALLPLAENATGHDGVGKAYAATPKLSAKKKTISAGKSVTLKVKNAGKKKIVWKSSNKKVATVTKKGVVKAKKAGKATITAKVGKKTLKCKVTVKAALNKSKVSLVKGKSLTLKVMGLSGKVKWSSSNKKVATVSSKGKVTAKKVGKATIKAKVGKKTFTCKVTVVQRAASTSKEEYFGSDSPNGTYKKPTTKDQKALAKKVGSYTYKIKPVNGKLNNIVFVETNNPDPNSFQLADESSKYLEKGKTALYKPLPYTYADVQYSNASTRRIANKGYLFYCYNCDSDGGSLRLLANKGYFYQSTSWGASYSDGTNYNTGKTLSAPALEDKADYLIRTYAAGKSGFFDKLDAVEAGLYDIALYPKSLLDTSKPNTGSGGYPCLATSPYPELSLNEHIESMYKEAEDGLFLDAAYGFVLHSLSFPGMMGSVAERINPACEVSAGATHAYVTITLNGKSRMYGGAGSGGSEPLYSKFITWRFKFDGTDKGYGTSPSMDTMKKARVACTQSSDALAEQYLASISDDALTKVMGTGTWIRCAVEGFGGGSTMCYISSGPDGRASVASRAWVDGRYVNQYECYEQDVKFSAYPKADIVLPDVTYRKKNGATVTGSVTYRYYSDTDDWRAPYYYQGDYWCSSDDIKNLATLSPNLVLTQKQVTDLVAKGVIDGKTNEVPLKGYIFDGKAKPGTYSDNLTKI